MAKGDTLSHRRVRDLNPSSLTSNPDFLRNGCLIMCFPFVLSFQTVSCPWGPGGELGQGSRVWGPLLPLGGGAPWKHDCHFKPSNSLSRGRPGGAYRPAHRSAWSPAWRQGHRAASRGQRTGEKGRKKDVQARVRNGSRGSKPTMASVGEGYCHRPGDACAVI